MGALGLFVIEWAKNASGEGVDFDAGTDQAVIAKDRGKFSGDMRVPVDGPEFRNCALLTPEIPMLCPKMHLATATESRRSGATASGCASSPLWN